MSDFDYNEYDDHAVRTRTLCYCYTCDRCGDEISIPMSVTERPYIYSNCQICGMEMNMRLEYESHG